MPLIDVHVQLPPGTGGRGSAYKYPFWRGAYWSLGASGRRDAIVGQWVPWTKGEPAVQQNVNILDHCQLVKR